MVSVLLATYNDEKYIEKAVCSVLEQTYTDFELLIGFNGTIDSSKEIVAKFNDDRIRIFDYGDDNGKSKTLNKMLKEAEGDWYAIQDGDDVWAPKKLERQMRFSSDFDVIGTQITYVNENGVPIGGPNLAREGDDIKSESLNGNNQVANSSAIFRKECADSTNGWDESLVGIEDFDFWLKLMRSGYKFINIPTHEVFHRIHSESNFNTNRYDISKIL